MSFWSLIFLYLSLSVQLPLYYFNICIIVGYALPIISFSPFSSSFSWADFPLLNSLIDLTGGSYCVIKVFSSQPSTFSLSCFHSEVSLSFGSFSLECICNIVQCSRSCKIWLNIFSSSSSSTLILLFLVLWCSFLLRKFNVSSLFNHLHKVFYLFVSFLYMYCTNFNFSLFVHSPLFMTWTL